MTLLEMYDLAGLYLNDPSLDRHSQAELLKYLNRAQEDVQGLIDEHDEEYFSGCQDFTVVAATDAYEFTLPSDVKSLVLVERLVPGAPPVPVWWRDFPKRHLFATLGYPIPGETPETRCYLRGTKIGVVAPTQGFTLRAWFTRRLAALASDADVSEIPAEHHELIVLEAVKRAMGSEDWGSSQFEDLRLDKRAKLETSILSRQVQQPRHVNFIPF